VRHKFGNISDLKEVFRNWICGLCKLAVLSLVPLTFRRAHTLTVCHTDS